MHQSGSVTFRTRLLPRRTTAFGAKADLANSTIGAESSAAVVRGMMDLECPLSRVERTQLRSRPLVLLVRLVVIDAQPITNFPSCPPDTL
jgi:hypothetical protein